MRRWTISCIAVLAVTLAAGKAATADVVLTGLGQFSAASSGAAGSQFWNTLGGDGNFNLYVIASSDIDGPFINSGNAAAASVNLPLTVGTHEFTIYGQPGSAASHAGLNLFFNDAVPPAISVLAPHNSSTIAPNFSSSTRSLTSTIVAAAGTLSFTVDNLTVSLTDYIWSSPGQSLGPAIGCRVSIMPPAAAVICSASSPSWLSQSRRRSYC